MWWKIYDPATRINIYGCCVCRCCEWRAVQPTHSVTPSVTMSINPCILSVCIKRWGRLDNLMYSQFHWQEKYFILFVIPRQLSWCSFFSKRTVLLPFWRFIQLLKYNQTQLLCFLHSTNLSVSGPRNSVLFPVKKIRKRIIFSTYLFTLLL